MFGFKAKVLAQSAYYIIVQHVAFPMPIILPATLKSSFSLLRIMSMWLSLRHLFLKNRTNYCINRTNPSFGFVTRLGYHIILLPVEFKCFPTLKELLLFVTDPNNRREEQEE